MDLSKYNKLNKVESYDHEKVELLAELQNEMWAITQKLDEMNELNTENKELYPFIWKTAENKCIPLHKLEDDHLKNILKYIVENNRVISVQIKAEARKRGIPLPAGTRTIAQRKEYIDKLGHMLLENDISGESIAEAPIDFRNPRFQ